MNRIKSSLVYYYYLKENERMWLIRKKRSYRMETGFLQELEFAKASIGIHLHLCMYHSIPIPMRLISIPLF